MGNNELKGNVLITGGAGFLGSNLAVKLCESSRVRLFDNLARNSLPHLDYPLLDKAELVKGDITDPMAVKKAVEDVDTVIHMAAIAGVHNYYSKPFEVMRVNVGGVLNLLSALQGTNVKRLVFVSTSEVYGTEAKNVDENAPLATGDINEMRWSYAVSKIAGEKACAAFAKQTGISTAVLRPFNIFGPGQTGEGAIRDMALAALKGETVKVHGDGSQVRAWCHVDDFIDGTLSVLKADEIGFEVFNIGNSSNACSIAELAELIVDSAGTGAKIEKEPHFGTDIRYRTPDISKAADVLGYEPKIGIKEGLKPTVAWYKQKLL